MRLIAKAKSERGVAAVLPSSAWNKLWTGAEHEGWGELRGGWVTCFSGTWKRATLIYAEISSDYSWIFMEVSQRELCQREREGGEDGWGGVRVAQPLSLSHMVTLCAIHSHSIRTSFSYLLCQFVFHFFPDYFTPGKLTRRDISSIDWVNFNQT